MIHSDSSTPDLLYHTTRPVRLRPRGEIKVRLMPLEKACQLIHHERQKGLIRAAGIAADMGTEKDIGQLKNLTRRGDRLRVKDIQRGDDVAPLEPGQQRRRINNRAP